MISAVCPTCPWRRGATAEPIPAFDACKARGLRSTVGDGSDAFRPIMACHGSRDGDERPCGGYLAVVGMTNLHVRVLLARGVFTMPETADVDLVDSFDAMLQQVDA